MSVVSTLVFFRNEVRSIVKWITGFKKIEKTAEGYLFGGVSSAENSPVVTEKQEVKLVAESQDEAVNDEEVDWLQALWKKDYQRSKQLLEDQLLKETDDQQRVTLRAFLAHVRFEENRIEGIDAFERIIREHPEHPRGFLWYAYSYRWRDEIPAAMDILDRGLVSVVDKLALQVTKAEFFRSVGRHADALALSEQMIDEFPLDSRGYESAAEAVNEMKNTDRAKEYYRKAISVAPSDRDLRSKVAEYMLNHGANDEALVHYLALIAVEGENPIHWGYLGNTYLNLDLYSLALAAYERSNELAPSPQAWIVGNMGNLHKRTGLYTSAIRYLKEALELDPSSKYAHQRLAETMTAEEEEHAKRDGILLEARRRLSSLAVVSPGETKENSGYRPD